MFVKTLPLAKSNISTDKRDLLATWYASKVKDQGFMREETRRLEATEVFLFDSPDQPGRKEAKLVCELDVTHGEFCYCRTHTRTDTHRHSYVQLYGQHAWRVCRNVDRLVSPSRMSGY